MKRKLRAAAGVCVLLACAAASAQVIGQEAPEIGVPGWFGDGDRPSLAKYRGKIIVLTFWRSNDDASREALPTLNKLHSHFSSKGVKFIAFTPEDKQPLEEFFKQNEIEHQVAYGVPIPSQYEVTSLPRTFLIDPAGRLAWRGDPEDDLEYRIERQIRHTPPPGSNAKALRKRLARVTGALDDGKLMRTYTLAKDLAADADEGTSVAKRADELIAEVEKAVEDWVDEAKQAINDDDPEDGCRKIAELTVRLEGSKIAGKAKTELRRLRRNKKLKPLLDAALANARAGRLHDRGLGLEAGGRYAQAVEAYRGVIEQYTQTEAAKTAKKSLDRINASKRIQAALKKSREAVEADRWIEIGDRYTRVDMKEQARAYYKKVVKEHPKSAAAPKARERLAMLDDK